MAPTINPSDITIDHMRSPAQQSGFRAGQWRVSHAGTDYRVFESIPAQCSLDEQTKRVQATAAREIADGTAEEIKPGRPAIAAGQTSTTLTFRLTSEQRTKVDRLGGADWLRKQIDLA